MNRNPEDTRKRLLQAVASLLVREGFRGLKINSIAKQAGVDKVLIYRYFGGLPELLQAFADSREFWPSLEQQLETNSLGLADLSEEEILRRTVRGFLRELERKPLLTEMLRWELCEINPATADLSAEREAWFAQMLTLFPSASADQAAAFAVITAGLTHLQLLSKTHPLFAGINFQSSEGHQRFEDAAIFLLRAVTKVTP